MGLRDNGFEGLVEVVQPVEDRDDHGNGRAHDGQVWQGSAPAVNADGGALPLVRFGA